MVACVARNCYEELQVVTAQLPENLSCVALPVLRARQATQDKSGRYGSNSGHFRKPGLRHTQFSEIDLPEYLLRRWWAYDDSHFKSAAATTTPKRKARTAYTLSPKRNVTNVVTKETIKPRKSTLHHAPLADEYANSLSFSCLSCLLLARALSLLDTLLDDRLRTLMQTSLRGLGPKGLRLTDHGLYGSFVALHIAGLDYVLHPPPSSNSIGERRVENRPTVGQGLRF